MVSLIVIVAAVAQHAPEAEGLTAYEFTLRNGELVYAYADPRAIDNVRFEIVYDLPWEKRAAFDSLQKINVVEAVPEGIAAREGRERRAWEDAGGVQVRDRAGQRYWVLASDKEKAESAQAFYAAAFPVRAAAANDADLPVELKDSGVSGPGFLQVWGWHVAIVSGVIAVGGAILWWAVRKPWAPV